MQRPVPCARGRGGDVFVCVLVCLCVGWGKVGRQCLELLSAPGRRVLAENERVGWCTPYGVVRGRVLVGAGAERRRGHLEKEFENIEGDSWEILW